MAWFLFIFGLARMAVSLVNWAARLYLPDAHRTEDRPPVSVLIPARNEEKTIGRLLTDLQAVRYTPLEIIVYDDQSTDRTAAIVERFATEPHPVGLIGGTGLPPGWLGKNRACHCLSAAATGRWLLFLDADVRIGNETISKAVAHMERQQLRLLSVFPTQRMPSWGARLSVPLMNWILLSLLPLPLVRLSGHPALAAANGQFLMFDRAAYKRISPHEAVKNNPVEDMAIMKKFKEEKLPVATLLGGKDIFCTMYTTLSGAVQGFSRNIVQFFGGHGWLAALFVLLTTLAPFYLFRYAGTGWGTAYIGVILLNHLFVSLASCQSAIGNIGLLIPRQIVLWIILLASFLNRRRHKLRWKGRIIGTGC